MKCIASFAFLLSSLLTAQAFVPGGRVAVVGWRQQIKTVFSRQMVTTTEDLEDVGFSVTVKKPLGIVFGENPAPYLGLMVDDVEPGLNGGAVGIKVGDQLLSINSRVVIGNDFESTMDVLRTADSLELLLFRGPVRTLYTILENKDAQPEDEEEEEDEIERDESYESPVQINLEDFEDEPMPTAGDFMNAFKKVASGLSGGEKTEEEKKKGLFGGMFSGESVQLDGDDANTLK
jgi:hypothetical protein